MIQIDPKSIQFDPIKPDDKKGVDRSSTVIARDGTEGRLTNLKGKN